VPTFVTSADWVKCSVLTEINVIITNLLWCFPRLCCRSSAIRNVHYRARLVAASSHSAALARCTRASHVQAQCHDVQLSTWSSAAVLARCLPTSLRRHVTASSPICWSATAERTAPEVEYIARRAFSVAGPLVWNSLSDYLRDPAVSRDTFCKHLKTFLFEVYWYTFSALEVLRRCAE